LRLKGTIKNLKKNKSFELFFNFNLNHSFLKTYKQFHSFKKSKNKKATVFWNAQHHRHPPISWSLQNLAHFKTRAKKLKKIPTYSKKIDIFGK